MAKHTKRGKRDSACACQAKQALIDEVFGLLAEMENRLDPEWAYRCKRLGELL